MPYIPKKTILGYLSSCCVVLLVVLIHYSSNYILRGQKCHSFQNRILLIFSFWKSSWKESTVLISSAFIVLVLIPRSSKIFFIPFGTLSLSTILCIHPSHTVSLIQGCLPGAHIHLAYIVGIFCKGFVAAVVIENK